MRDRVVVRPFRRARGAGSPLTPAAALNELIHTFGEGSRVQLFCDEAFSQLTDASAAEFVRAGRGEAARRHRRPARTHERDVRREHGLPARAT